MKTLKISFIFLITVFTFVLMSGCSKEESPTTPPPPGGGGSPIDALVGAWNATSVTNPGVQGGANLIGPNDTMKFTFTATNYTYAGTGQFCDEGEETCTQTAPVTATATSIAVAWPGGDPQTINYTLSGNTLTLKMPQDDGTYTFICSK